MLVRVIIRAFKHSSIREKKKEKRKNDEVKEKSTSSFRLIGTFRTNQIKTIRKTATTTRARTTTTTTTQTTTQTTTTTTKKQQPKQQ